MGEIGPQLFDIEYFSRKIWFVLYRTGHICVFSLPRSNSLERKNYVQLIQAANIRNQFSKTALDRNSHSGPGTEFLWIPKQAKMVPRSYTSSILWVKKVSSWSQAAKRLQMIAENKSSPGTHWATQPPTSDCKVDLIFFLSFGTIHHPYLKQSTRVHLRNWSIKEGDLLLFLVLSSDQTIFTCHPSTFSSFPLCHWQRFNWVFTC